MSTCYFSPPPPLESTYLVVLRRIGRPARVPEIAKELVEHGIGQNLSRQVFANSLFTAFSRRDDIFTKEGPGLWGLKEWQDAREKAP